MWEAAARKRRLGEFTAELLRLLARHGPAGAVRFMTLGDEADGGWLECVAAAATGGAALPMHERRALLPGGRRRLLAWIEHGSIEIERRTGSGRERFPLSLLGLDGTKGQVLAAPLVDGPWRGALLVAARPGEHWTPPARRQVESILPACGAALASEAQWRLAERMRAAADAERQALLRKLGRDDLGSEVIGSEGGLRPVMERVDLVARADVPVLILGETGSGKEVVARSVHQRSLRADGPFIRVNCGAIAPELIDSELFGHERGAFTGATGTRRGWFERADKGTLFLDEVGELPPAAQVRLLRVLQDGSIDRVGGEAPVQVDVRVIAATHRDLPQLVKEHRFREDLWYRLAVFPILLPPLRDRPEDIAPLARRFVHRAAQRFGLAEVAPSDADLELLRRYPWPGNVRELVSVIDRAVILGEGERLDLAVAIGSADIASGRGRPVGQDPAGRQPAESVPLTIDEAMRLHIDAVVASTGGRIEGPDGAARLLAINPHTLRSRMRKLGLDWSQHRRGPEPSAGPAFRR